MCVGMNSREALEDAYMRQTHGQFMRTLPEFNRVSNEVECAGEPEDNVACASERTAISGMILAFC